MKHGGCCHLMMVDDALVLLLPRQVAAIQIVAEGPGNQYPGIRWEVLIDEEIRIVVLNPLGEITTAT